MHAVRYMKYSGDVGVNLFMGFEEFICKHSSLLLWGIHCFFMVKCGNSYLKRVVVSLLFVLPFK
jgi:hypothetical protein